MIRTLICLTALGACLAAAPLFASPEKYLETPSGVGRLDSRVDGRVAPRPTELRREFARAYRAYDANEGRDSSNMERPWSTLGYPAGRVTWDADAQAFVQRFRDGRYGLGAIVVWPRDERHLSYESGAVSGVFLDWWQNVDGLAGRLRRPIGVQYKNTDDAWEQRYEGGWITMRKTPDGLAPLYRFKE